MTRAPTARSFRAPNKRVARAPHVAQSPEIDYTPAYDVNSRHSPRCRARNLTVNFSRIVFARFSVDERIARHFAEFDEPQTSLSSFLRRTAPILLQVFAAHCDGRFPRKI
ncbi:hypothetical protein [Mesorhizobium sp. M0088]|uniref:hypothetical protein n=1 Tax=Mesorhizobium sp. M0088 TaxID=2956873 RepID=UPI003338F763